MTYAYPSRQVVVKGIPLDQFDRIAAHAAAVGLNFSQLFREAAREKLDRENETPLPVLPWPLLPRRSDG